MKKEQFIYNRGFSVIEVVLASALLGIFVTAFMGAFLFGQEASIIAGNRAQAIFYAEEGLEIVRNIRDDDFGNLVDGTYGLATTSNQWVFSGTNNTKDLFTRAITINALSVNEKEVTSNVTWQQNGQRTGSVSLVSRFTNWLAPTVTMGDGLNIDATASSVAGILNSDIENVTIENTSANEITVSAIYVSWNNAILGTRLNEISIGGESVFIGDNGSGDLADVSDFLLPVGSGVIDVDYLRFSEDMTGTEITLYFVMSDSTTKSITFNPSGGGPAPDTVAPDPISSLASSGITETSATLSWTATGDDGSTGTATTYDIRYSSSNITEANFASATQIVGEPSPQVAGSPETLLVSGLSPNTTYYFAIKVLDEVPNTSGLSSVANFTTLNVTQAARLSVNTSTARIAPGNNRRVINITLGNTGSPSITIATMSVSWTGLPSNTRIRIIRINATNVWTGNAATGALLNNTDVTIPAGVSGVPINYLEFSRSVAGSTMSITFNMSDGSQKIVSGISL